MFGLLLVASLAVDSTTLCVQDALTHAPLPGTHVSVLSGDGHPVASRTLDARCLRIPAGTVRLRRVGYRARSVQLPVTGVDQQLVVELTPLSFRRAATPPTLATQRVVASRADSPTSRVTATMDVDHARVMGVGTTTALLASLPFVSVRSARGETGVSLRGARREQVAITLDGMLLNDPATGIADVSDLPLASLGSATALLGADPLGVGPGANGGVIALTSAPQRVVALRAGSFGTHAAHSTPRG